MRYLIALLWLVIFTKKIFFWVYLWQLKEYHIGRFLDHFRTYKGKKLVFNYLPLVKILTLFGIILSARRGWTDIKFDLVYFTALIFFLEAAFAIKSFWQKTFKRPVLTKKVLTILNTCFSLEILIIFFAFLLELRLTRFTALFLLFDILAPIILSFLVLLFQPIAVILRNRLIGKAKKKREQFPNLLVIGITGSYGKTSTKEFLATILSEKFNVLKTKEHQNSEVGVSQCILEELDSGHQIFICEMGAYNRGGIKLLCDIAKPKIGVLTGINEQHMATFGSQENIIKAKYELIESLPKDGTAFFNGKNKYCVDLYNKTQIKKYLYGQEAKVFGEENLLGAKAVAKQLGMAEEEISLAISRIENKLPGIGCKKGINGLIIFDATFSANPDGVIGHLEYLKSWSGKKVIVMPCLIELGKASKDVHQRIGKKIAEVCDLAIITTKDRFKEIQETAGGKAIFMENSQEIFEKIKSAAQAGDTVLLESRVPKQLISLLLGK